MKRSTKPPSVDCLGQGIMPYDLLMTVDKFPDPEIKIDAKSMIMQGGGPVPTVMIGLARFGHKTTMIGVVGDDPIGDIGIGELKSAGVDTRFVVRRKNTTSAVATGWVETGSGRRTLVLGRTVFQRPSDFKLDLLPIPKIVHLDGRDLDATIKLAKWGKKIGAIVSFDIGSIRNDVSPAFKYVDHLVVADSYAFPFTKKSTSQAAAKMLGQYGPSTVVITEGINGSTGFEAGAVNFQPAYKVESVDTTGAGDAYHAGYLHGLLLGLDLPERMKLGAATGAIKCRKPGARAGLPTRSALMKFIASNPKTY